jgi:hypothetical protein
LVPGGSPLPGRRGLCGFLDYVSERGDTVIPWTKPEDLLYDPDRPLPRLGGLLKGGFLVAFGDGSVRRSWQEPSEATLRALIPRNGGDEPGPDWQW